MKKFFIFFIVLGFPLFSQFNPNSILQIEKILKPEDEARFNRALLAFKNKEYYKSTRILDSLSKTYPKSVDMLYLFSCSASYLAEWKDMALKNLLNLREYSPLLENYSFFMGQAYELNDSIDQAIYWFSKYDKEFPLPNPVNPELKELIPGKLKNLSKAREMKLKTNVVKIKNIGSPINTEAWEYTPLLPQDESFMIFTYRGPRSKGGKQKVAPTLGKVKEEEKIYFEDVFMSYRVNDSGWSVPQPVSSINTLLHDAAVALSHDGRELFIYKNLGKGYGDLYLSYYDGKNWSIPYYQKGLNTDKWEGSAAFMPDKDEIIFASERPGGFGKKDLWKAKRIGPNLWGKIENLGPDINSSDDEDAPFVTPDGKILFFSTNGKLSTGGYDIVRSDLGEDGKWKKPYNIGKPINTPFDDKFFITIGNGSRAYYSSHKEDSKGEQDIYLVEPGIPGEPVSLVQVVAYCYLNHQPAEALVKVNAEQKGFSEIKIKTGKYDGKALLQLPSGMTYSFEFSLGNFPPQVKTLDVPKQDTFISVTVYNDFFDQSYLDRIKKKEDSLRNVANNRSSEAEFKSFMDVYADYQNDTIFFKVQVGAYRFMENFDMTRLLKFGKIQRIHGNDNITRFYMGNFKTIREIKPFLESIRVVLPDVFVVVHSGKNVYYLSDFRKILESKK